MVRIVDSLWASVKRRRERDERGLVDVVLDADLQRPEKLRILIGEVEFGFVVFVGRELLPVDQVSFSALIEADGDFEHEEKVVTCGANAPHHVSNSIRLCQ
jgi:hypothetical protein